MKIKKILILTLTLLFLMAGVAYADICADTPLSNKTCQMVTPPITCNTYNYSIYDNNYTVNEVGNLSIYADNIYYFNFSKNNGQFSIVLCDGTYKEVYVNGDGEVITGSILAILGVIGILLVVYLKIDEMNHKIFRTFLLCFIVYLTLLIPRALSSLIVTNFSYDFVSYYVWFLRVFTIYLMGYFIWSIADYYKKTDMFKQWFKDNFGNKGGR